jgi:hypothetical protein
MQGRFSVKLAGGKGRKRAIENELTPDGFTVFHTFKRNGRTSRSASMIG